MPETADITALRRGRPLRICSGKIRKHTAPPNVISHPLGLLLRRCELGRIVRLRSPNQYLAQTDLTGLTKRR